MIQAVSVGETALADELGPYVETSISYHDREEFRRHGRSIRDRENPAEDTWMLEARAVRVHDARQARQPLSFAANGFAMLDHPTTVDLRDRDQVERAYFPQAAELLKALTGAEEAHCFGQVLRSDQPETVASWQTAAVRDRTRGGVAHNAHVDYDEAAGRAYLADMVGEDRARALADRRIVVINLWRGVTPVERRPLAVCDAGSVSRDDLMTLEVRGPVGPTTALSRNGYAAMYSPAHRWFYYPRMQPNELLVFTLCDSDPARAQFCLHTSFDDPTARPDAPGRLSLDIRAICVMPA